MKRKRLALLLAAAMTVTSLDTSALFVSGADFSSEVEEEVTTQATEGEEATVDEDPVDVDFSDEEAEVAETPETSDADVEVAEDEASEDADVQVEDEADEPDFSAELEEDAAVEAGASIIPADVQKLELDKDYRVEDGASGAWFSYTPTEDGKYIFSSSDNEEDTIVYLYDSADVENEDGYVNSDDDSGVGRNFMLSRALNAETTYYYYARNRGDENGSFSVRFEKGFEVENVSLDVSEAKKEFVANLDRYSVKGVKLLVTYKGQSTQNVVTFNDNSTWVDDGKGNSFYYSLKKGEEGYSPYDVMEEGEYQATFYQDNGEKIGDVSVTAKKPDLSKFDSLKVGSNTVEILREYGNRHWYLFEVPEDGLYTVVRTGEDYDGDINMDTKIVDADGNIVEGSPEYDRNNETYTMKKGEKILYTWYTYWDENVSTEEVVITKVPRVKSVNVTADVKSEYIENIDFVRPDDVQAVVTYEDGTTQTLDTYEKDTYGRRVYWRLYDQNGAELDDYDYLSPGDYTFKFYFVGIELKSVPIKVASLDSKTTDEISDGEANVNNKGNIILKYTAAEDGRYQFAFNVKVSEVNFVRPDGGYVNYSTENKNVYADFEKGITYYVYAVPDEVCEKLTVNVSLTTRPTSLSAKSLRKSDYVAGIDSFSVDDIETTVNFGNTSTTVRGNGRVEGYTVNYDLLNTENGKTFNDGTTLSKGTWTVTPRLNTGSSIEVSVQETTVKSVMYSNAELEKFPVIEEDKWNLLENSYGERKLYTFTPKKTGIYHYECKAENHEYSVNLYEADENEYRRVQQNDEDSQVSLTAGKKYLVVNTDGTSEVKFSYVASGLVPETVKELALTVGMKKAVEIDKTTGSIKCTFTPSEDGYYILKSSQYEGIYADPYTELHQENTWVGSDDEGDDNNNFRLIAKLSAGKVYTYTVAQYDSGKAPFVLEFNKTEKKDIKAVELVLKNGKKAADYRIFDNFGDFYQLKITYTDGTTGVIDTDTSYYGSNRVQDSYGNWTRVDLQREGSEAGNKITVQADIVYNGADGKVQNVKTSVECKAVGSLEEVKEGKNYQVPKSKTYYKFIPQETGEYIFAKADNSENAYMSAYLTDAGNMYVSATDCYEGENTYSGNLEKGKTYYIVTGSDQAQGTNATFCVRKTKKTLNGLTLKKAPDNTNVLPNNGTVSYKGIQVVASYTDGSTETVNYGQADSEGRYLHSDEIIWLANGNAKVYVALGRYSVSFDAKAGSWDAVPEIKLGEKKTLSAGKDDITTLKFVPKESGIYYINVDGGYLIGGIRGTYADDDRDYYNGCYLKANETYYLNVQAAKDNPSITVNASCKDGKHSFSAWNTVTAATCVTEGWRTRTCTVCGKIEEETIKATGVHTFGAWKVIKNATCAADGKRSHTCTGCGKTEEETIKATGKHTMSSWKVTSEATVSAEGSQTRSCSICGKKETAKIAKLKPTMNMNVTANKTLPLKVKQSFQVKISGLAKGDKVVSWASSNKKIATVSAKGKITGKKAGTATITVKLVSGQVRFKVKVQKAAVATTSLKVVNKATGKTIKSATLKAKKKLSLSATVAPVTSKQKVTYSSSNKKIATVNSKGVITAKKKGKVTITVKSGKKSVKIKIKVTK